MRVVVVTTAAALKLTAESQFYLKVILVREERGSLYTLKQIWTIFGIDMPQAEWQVNMCWGLAIFVEWQCITLSPGSLVGISLAIVMYLKLGFRIGINKRLILTPESGAEMMPSCM